MRVLLLILFCLASLAGCTVEHHHNHEHHYDKLLPKKNSARPPAPNR